MLNSLFSIKQQIMTLLVNIKINLFIPKIYKLSIINFLVVIYSNLINNLIKVIQIKYTIKNVYNIIAYWYIFWINLEILYFII